LAAKQGGRRVHGCVLRALAVVFGLALAVIVVEGAIRLLYGSLPMSLQIGLRNVHLTPFTDQPLAPPPLWQTDSDYLTIVRPGAVNSLQAGSPTVTFHVSSYAWWGGRVGFRSPQPDSGAVEAVALGDSFTFCFTEIDDCWTSILAQQTGLNLSNLGQPVTGSVSHARIYYDFVAKPELRLRQPRLVLWQFYGNDYNDDYGLASLNGTAKTPPKPVSSSPPLPQSSLAVWLRKNSAIYLIVSSLIRGKDAGVEQFVDPYHTSAGNVDLWFGQGYIRQSFDMAEPRNREGEELSRQAILQTRDLVEKNGGKFVVIVMPTKEEVYRPLTEPLMGKAAVDAIAEPRLRLLDFCTAQKLTCFDLLPKLQEQSSIQLYYPTDQHLNAQGNHVVAAAIAELLEGMGFMRNMPR
jgi:SGNH hydrolase-like domain, acetyltransferase AlgX